MKIIENTAEFYIEGETATAIGKFDGFHRGHQKLLGQLNRQREKGLKSVVFTFVPSPAAFFSREPIRELSTLEEKRRIFENAGVDYLIEYPFNQEIADMEPETYIREVLVSRIHAKCVVAGEDVSYGKHGAGNYQLLQKMASEYGYQVILIDKVMHRGKEVSSTYVREEVGRGNMELVAELLGAPYHVSGEIIHGKKLGRTIGMPTVNILPSQDKLLPPRGVYYSYAYLHSKAGDRLYDGKRLAAITNIGTKPTVDQRSVMGVETYLYDFDGDVYGENIDVCLLKRKRPEMRFDGVDALKAQMTADIAEGRSYHGLGIYC
ncbi:MAG: bifunctional riboflavin kinase/FAD synthetase [Lachnospiraceae bacterium]|nr:bifunctional riboflavin kinase/FAD synthetase [Lachnospiraceae bacterium]